MSIGITPAGLKCRKGVMVGCGQRECKACYEPIASPECLDTKFQRMKEYLDTLTTAQALWWFIENVDADDPNRSTLFFYCRERVHTDNQE